MLGNGRVDHFTATELPNSRTPALLGRNSLRHYRSLIDTFTGKVFFVGPGGYELKLSPGSEQYDLHDSEMGHLMLPCSKGRTGTGRSSESMTFVEGTYFQASRSSTSSGSPKGLAQTEYYDMACDDGDWIDNLVEEVAAPLGEFARHGRRVDANL